MLHNGWLLLRTGPARLDQQAHRIAQLEQRVQALSRMLRTDHPRPDPVQQEAFYLALEAEFRGSAEDVRQRLQAHRHWVDMAPIGPAADLGCGRGEWLDLLALWGRPAIGVDTHGANVRSLRERGLQAEQADAIEWMVAQPSSHFALLTAFHLVEHLHHDDVILLFSHAQRMLVPGGLLILETPNPENLRVATETFWLDPTHQRPLPPDLLGMTARHVGLEVMTLARLHAPADDAGPMESSVLHRLVTEGRDVALVARKPA